MVRGKHYSSALVSPDPLLASIVCSMAGDGKWKEAGWEPWNEANLVVCFLW